MYGPWILAIVFGGLAVISLVMSLVAHCVGCRYAKLSNLINKWTATSVERKLKDLYEEKFDIWDNCCMVFFIMMIACLVLALIICGCGGLNLRLSKMQVLEFEENKKIVEDAYANGTNLDNVAMTKTIIEKNEWLAKAKVRLEIYGNFSGYYGSGVDTMEYISVGGVS